MEYVVFVAPATGVGPTPLVSVNNHWKKSGDAPLKCAVNSTLLPATLTGGAICVSCTNTGAVNGVRLTRNDASMVESLLKVILPMPLAGSDAIWPPAYKSFAGSLGSSGLLSLASFQ